jgi:hypothetical protein
MKNLIAAVVSVTLIQAVAAEEMKFRQPLAALKPEDVVLVSVTIVPKEGQGRWGWMTNTPADAQEYVRKLLKHATPKDYPVTEGPMSFSLPPALLKIEFRNAGGKVIAEITMLGAWNLLETRGPGMRKAVLGSNRLICDHLLRQLFAHNPDAHEEAAERFKENLSGRYAKEYREMLDAS